MKTKTIAVLASTLVIVNIGIGAMIYFLIKPEAKDALLHKISAIEVPQLPQVELPKMPEIELPRVEVTEEDVAAVTDSVKGKLLERAQLIPENAEELAAASAEDDVAMNEYVVDAWGLTFLLPDDVERFQLSLQKDVLTIEHHLQVMAYIARYDAGVKPAIDGHWELLASYMGNDFYVRKGDAIGASEAAETAVDFMRAEVYETLLKTYHFKQE